MKRLVLFFLIFFNGNFFAQSEKDFTKYVNPLIGSDSSHELSKGNTYPAIALPWGMNFWTPQTGKMGDGWIYTHKNSGLVGIRQTHQPSPWINDYGAFSVMPTTGALKVLEKQRKSNYKNQIVKPHHYKVKFVDSDIDLEVSPTRSSAHFKLSSGTQKKLNIIIDAFFKGSSVEINSEKNTIYGISKNNSGGVPENFSNYFIIEFKTPFNSYGTWDGSGKLFKNDKLNGDHVGAYVSYDSITDGAIEFTVSSSFISHEQALINLNREIPADQSFEATKLNAKKIWNNELSKIKITPSNEADEINRFDNMVKFYSCFYRTILFPRAFHEFDKDGKQIHYSPYNGKILNGPLYTDNGFWDTFRAVFPFYNLLYPEKMGEIIQGIMVNPYKESGWLPEWSSPGHRNCMIGSNSASIIAEAYIKGNIDFDIETAYQAILKNTVNEGPLSSVGRKGFKAYNSLGYIPFDIKVNESVARTLEYTYNDYCIYKLGEKLNKPSNEINIFKERSYNFKNVFDPSVNFMRGKSKKGDFETPFMADKWGGVFTEGSSWHYTWSVLHDVQGLINLMGGSSAFINKMDSIFSTPPTSDFSYYGFKIHEILEMELIEMGQYAHGNQPIQHALYLYNYVGQPWKTQEKVRYVMENLYGSAEDGYCGDEDNGQTSAWYLFSSIGFYPVAPVTGQYVIGSPMYDRVEISLSNDKKVIINTQNNKKESVYIEKLLIDGKEYDKNWFSHESMLNGVEIDFFMQNRPNFKWGSSEQSVPYSMSNKH